VSTAKDATTAKSSTAQVTRDTARDSAPGGFMGRDRTR
jgi:hypothetical protein